jgi:hypothetical protein
MDNLLSAFPISNIVFPVNSSAPAIITKISHSEKATPAITFLIPSGDHSNPVVAVIEKTAHNQIYIPASIPSMIPLSDDMADFLTAISCALAVISAGDRHSIFSILSD